MLMHATNSPVRLSRLPFPLVASEKLDGWRCLIHGGRLFTKSLGRFQNVDLEDHLADPILASRFGISFDCELYSPSLGFDGTDAVLKSKTRAIPDDLTAFCFDSFTATPEPLNYRSRIARVPTLRNFSPHAGRRFANCDKLRAEYRRVIRRGGEGLMLRLPDSAYIPGRMTVAGPVWKMKPGTFE
jgi:ATP-dependent DNA ligase